MGAYVARHKQRHGDKFYFDGDPVPPDRVTPQLIGMGWVQWEPEAKAAAPIDKDAPVMGEPGTERAAAVQVDRPPNAKRDTTEQSPSAAEAGGEEGTLEGEAPGARVEVVARGGGWYDVKVGDEPVNEKGMREDDARALAESIELSHEGGGYYSVRVDGHAVTKDRVRAADAAEPIAKWLAQQEE